ncbi:unnamed protein product, partial [Ectocarpus fasciculatus]
ASGRRWLPTGVEHRSSRRRPASPCPTRTRSGRASAAPAAGEQARHSRRQARRSPPAAEP